MVRTSSPTASCGKGDSIIYFCKYPRRGYVKTRLAPGLGEDNTLGLYRCFILDMLDKLAQVPFDTHMFLTPADKIPDMARLLNRDLPLHPQLGKDLGDRMYNAFETMFQDGCRACIIVGSDYPDLPLDILQRAFTALETEDAVLGPSADGGYYLLGFRRDTFLPEVFRGIEWSSERVYAQTLRVLANHDTKVTILQRWQDVDRFQDLLDFIQRNKDGEFANSRTMNLLRKIWTELEL